MLFRDVILPTTTEADWPGLRQSIHETIAATLGQAPQLDVRVLGTTDGEFAGLPSREIELEIIPGVTTYGRILFPPSDVESNGIGVVCPHGCVGGLGHRVLFQLEERPDLAYPYELASRGCVTIALDQFGFGPVPEQEQVEDFAQRFGDWSLDGARLAIQQAAVNVLLGLEEFACRRVACIGNSLGGRTSLMLAAFDERIHTAIVSTGVSPNLTNVYRNPPSPTALSPRLSEAIARDGRTPYEYQELISLIAPRRVVFLEPWNDPFNPFPAASLECIERTRRVWALLGADANCQVLYHGYGHATPTPMREYAYAHILAE